MVLRPAHPSEHPVRGARRENDDGDMAALQLYHTHTAAQADVLILFTSTGYMLLGLISSLVFRAIRDTLPNNPETQKRILGASMTALSLADVMYIVVSWVGLPEDLRYSFGSWSSMTHGNITFVVFLLSVSGRHYYGKVALKSQRSA